MRAVPVRSLRFWAGLGLALLVLTNASTLGLVAWNRSGEPEAVLALSERELRLPWRSSARRAEDSGVELLLRWRVAPGRTPGAGERKALDEDDGTGVSSYGRQALWLDAAKLAALGFPADETAAETGDDRHDHRRGRSRPVLLVLEFDGPAYRAALERAQARVARETALREANPGQKEFVERAKHAVEALVAQEREASRLFVVDAGRDAAALRAAYPDRARYAIVAGQVRPGWTGTTRPQDRYGWVESVDVNAIHVPHALKARVPDTVDGDDTAGRAGFVARLAFGRRLEPWIAAIEPAAPGP